MAEFDGVFRRPLSVVVFGVHRRSYHSRLERSLELHLGKAKLRLVQFDAFEDAFDGLDGGERHETLQARVVLGQRDGRRVKDDVVDGADATRLIHVLPRCLDRAGGNGPSGAVRRGLRGGRRDDLVGTNVDEYFFVGAQIGRFDHVAGLRVEEGALESAFRFQKANLLFVTSSGFGVASLFRVFDEQLAELGAL